MSSTWTRREYQNGLRSYPAENKKSDTRPGWLSIVNMKVTYCEYEGTLHTHPSMEQLDTEHPMNVCLKLLYCMWCLNIAQEKQDLCHGPLSVASYEYVHSSYIIIHVSAHQPQDDGELSFFVQRTRMARCAYLVLASGHEKISQPIATVLFTNFSWVT